eukprot:TRINITY_DN6833_c0_g1_i1.p1 TRINITY_DN6833_c0_g1~~TRINITY_DN6833_c0_g1_i1.p1  ORF type:complete len:915 (+),score=203.87 TRINITY_DN6833_c0_g1_i1:81-2825(+)
MEGLLGSTLLCGGNATVEKATATLQGKGIIAIYFSAHWCGPCQEYTPQLKKVYERCKASGKSFEVVFVSSDKDDASFRQYFGTMPWLAVPFADRTRQQTLNLAFGIRGIPSVVLLNGAGGLVDGNGRSKVMSPSFPSTIPRTIDLEDVGPLPSEPVELRIKHNGVEHEIECDPDEGWELLRMQIFSVTEVPSEQQRLFGLGVPIGPLSEDVPLGRVIARARKQAVPGTDGIIANVPDDGRKASTVHNDEAEGIGHHRGRLDSPQAWSAKKDDAAMKRLEIWYQMDLGEEKRVSGVAVAPRAGDCQQSVTKFKASFAVSQDGPWSFVADGREFDGPPCCLAPVACVIFPEAITARLVRIYPTAYSNHPSLRADVILVDKLEEAQKSGTKSLPTIVVLGNASAADPFEVTGTPSPPDPNAKMIEEQHLAMLQAKVSNMPPRLHNQVGSQQHVLKYEDLALQRHALDQIPVVAIDEVATKGLDKEAYDMAFMRHVVRWFKHDFFTWTNAPPCDHCGSRSTKGVGSTAPTPIEKSYGAGNVEIAECSTCGLQTRFPRYNDPAKLLETRTGRCGEWANCFTLVCRALGYEARHVHDWTDHVWTEFFSDSADRWVHADSCEAAIDAPLMYEKGWGKKLTYLIAFGRDNVCDVSKRYTCKFDELLTRRTQFPEQQLRMTMRAVDEFAMETSLARLQEYQRSGRQEALTKRAEKEAQQLEAGPETAKKAAEEVGRTSGDKEWREQRGELGADAAAKAKAIQCSETGVDGLAAADAVPGSWRKSAEIVSMKDGLLVADLRQMDGTMNRTSVQVEAGVSYSNNNGNFEVESRTAVTVSAAPEAKASPTGADSAAQSSQQPCATPAAPAAEGTSPKAAEDGKTSMRDLVKKRFAELVASGLPPEEAALKAMDEVKKMAVKAPAAA